MISTDKIKLNSRVTVTEINYKDRDNGIIIILDEISGMKQIFV